MKKIIDIVKDQKAHFVFYRDQSLFYETDGGFQFPVPIGDAGSATFNSEEKAILLMRYIRKHVELLRKQKMNNAPATANKALQLGLEIAPLQNTSANINKHLVRHDL